MDATTPTVAAYVVLRGQVQGVGFRYTTRAEAQRLGVSGLVRNRADGTVEAELYGTAAQIKQMLAWLEHGPEGAVVTSLETSIFADAGTVNADRVDRAAAPRTAGEFRIIE